MILWWALRELVIVITPRDCTIGKVIGSIIAVVVVVAVVIVVTNFGISQNQGTSAACKRHIGVATVGNQFNTTGVCSICRLSDAFCWATYNFFARNVKW